MFLYKVKLANFYQLELIKVQSPHSTDNITENFMTKTLQKLVIILFRGQK